MKFIDHWKTLGPEERKALAEATETKVVYLSQVAYEHRLASQKLALKIEHATSGAVTRGDLRPDLNPIVSLAATA